MILQKNQLVQIRFHNNIFFDAIIESWSDEKSILRLPNSDDIVIIHNTLRDVLLVRLINTKEEKQPEQVKEELAQEFEDLKDKPKDQEVIKSMAALKIQLNQLEKEELQTKTHSFEGTGIRQVNYGLPIAGIKKHTAEKTAIQNNGINSGLQQLFRKKH